MNRSPLSPFLARSSPHPTPPYSEDSFGVSFGDFLNVHTPLLRGNDDGAVVFPVHQDGKVELAVEADAFMDEDLKEENTI